jgi:hypothetical protein
MAVTESRPAHHDGEPPSADGPGPPRRHPWRRRILVGLGLLLTTAVVALAVLAGTYQPIRFGDFYGGDFPGLPHGTGLRSVNTFAGATGEIYVPQQSGAFSVIPSIANNGPLAVTIEAVSILSPQQQADAGQGVAPFPLLPAGPVRWAFEYTSPGQPDLPGGRSVAGISLPPGQGMSLGIPLQMSGICYDPAGWTHVDVFYVKERFGIFTHWVAVHFQPSLIMHSVSPPGGPGAEPARDLVCPAGISKRVSR